MAAKKPPKQRKPAAAAAETQSAERTLNWKGLTITLPPQLPEEILLDLALVRSEEGSGATFDLLLTAIGKAQYMEVRHKVKSKEATVSDVAELADEVFGVYGASEGE